MQLDLPERVQNWSQIRPNLLRQWVEPALSAAGQARRRQIDRYGFGCGSWLITPEPMYLSARQLGDTSSERPHQAPQVSDAYSTSLIGASGYP
jgi:hypothetical protein